MDLYYRKALEDHRQDPLMELNYRKDILKTHVALSLVTLVGDIGDPLRLCGCKIRGLERIHRWKEHGKFEPEQIDRLPIAELETPGPEQQLHANHKSCMALNQAIKHKLLRT